LADGGVHDAVEPAVDRLGDFLRSTSTCPLSITKKL
jgi:hypothetical protein